MNGVPRNEHVDDSLSHLYKAHTTLAHIMLQVDGLVLKAHKMSTHSQIGALDLCSFSQFLAETASSLQEWIPRFEDATHRVQTKDPECSEKETSISFRKKKERNDEDSAANEDNLLQPGNLLDVSVDEPAFVDKENALSDSPLVPWIDSVQFFVLTPMAKHKKSMRRCSFKDQESLQSPSPSSAITSHTHAEAMETIPAAANESPLLSCESSAKEERNISDNLLVSLPSTPSRLQHHSFESPDTINIATPLPPQSLVKRYSNFFEADERFAEEEEEEGVEIREYYTAFSPPRLIAPCVSMPGKGPCSSSSELLSPQDKAVASAPHLGVRTNVEHITPLAPQSLMKRYYRFLHAEEDTDDITEYFIACSPPRSIAPGVSTPERGPCSLSSELLSPRDKAVVSAPHLGVRRNVEHGTPLLPQSLMKRYSRFLNVDEDGDEMADSIMMLTPMLVRSPPKTCILIRPNHKEDTVKPRHSLQTPRLLLKSPLRTPGLLLKNSIDYSCYEDMDLTSLKKPGHPPWPLESVRGTPTSDMQFATVMRAPLSIKRTPLIDLQLSTVRKPGAPLPGEQTLKRELWCRMEAEFASITHVCKSLFTDNQLEASAEVGKSGIENRQPKGGFVPRGLQQRYLNL